MSLLAERLLLGDYSDSLKAFAPPELQLIRDGIEQAHLFKVDNVARYLWGNKGKRDYEAGDFPEVRPPFPCALFEYAMPMDLFPPIPRGTPHIERVADLLVENKGTVFLWRFIQQENDIALLPARLMYDVERLAEWKWWGREGVRKIFGVGTLAPTLFTLSLLSCKNVVLTEHATPPKLIKKRVRRGDVPSIRWTTLEIGPITTALDRAVTEGAATDIKHALHVCRGHFKTFDRKPLFGRVKGRFWWTPHVRGSAEEGVVFKDYNVTRTELE